MKKIISGIIGVGFILITSYANAVTCNKITENQYNKIKNEAGWACSPSTKDNFRERECHHDSWAFTCPQGEPGACDVPNKPELYKKWPSSGLMVQVVRKDKFRTCFTMCSPSCFSAASDYSTYYYYAPIQCTNNQVETCPS